MKIIRVSVKNEAFYAELKDDCVLKLSGMPYSECSYTGEKYKFEDCKLLPPCEPTKIVAVGKNYPEHAKEMNEPAPADPLLFLKPNTTVIAYGDEVVYPKISNRVDYEGELGVVIGKSCRNATLENALSFVFGYTCLNDVTARDIQKGDLQWTRGKGFDTFCPVGPCIVTELCADDLQIETRLNGKTVQYSRTSEMTHKLPKLIAYISRVMTLLPGDIIATGTPAGIGSMCIGDVVEVDIEGIGILKNSIVAEKDITA